MEFPKKIYCTQIDNGCTDGELFLNCDSTSINESMCDYVRADLSNPQWHDVKDGLPPLEENVIVVDEYNFASIAWLMQNDNGTSSWVTREDGYHTANIVAWCRIPEYNRKN